MKRKILKIIGAGFLAAAMFFAAGAAVVCAQQPKTSASPEKPEIFVQLGHSGNIKVITWLPDGKYLLSGGDDKTVKIWNFETGREVRTFAGSTTRSHGSVNALAVSPDSRFAASGGFDDSHIHIWDIKSGAVAKKLLIGRGKEEEGTHALAFSPDGKILAAACYIDAKQFIRFYDWRGGKTLKELKGHKSAISSIAFSPDGRQLISGSGWLYEESRDNTVRLWDVQKGAEIRRFSGHALGIMSVAFSPDGRFIASSGMDKTIRLWKKADLDAPPMVVKAASAVKGIAFSPDSHLIISSQEEGLVELRDVLTGKPQASIKSHAEALAFSPDGSTVGLAHYKTVFLWDVAKLQAGAYEVKWRGDVPASVRKLGGNVYVPNIAYFSADGDRLKIAVYNKLFEYGAQTGLMIASSDIIRSFEIGGTIRHFLARDIRTQPHADVVIDSRTDREILRHSSQSKWPYIQAFSADGRQALTTSFQPDRLSLITTDNFTEKTVLSSNPGSAFLKCFEFSPDGKTMAGAFSHSNDPDRLFIRLWDANTGKLIRKFPGHTHYITALTFTPDSKRILSGGMDDTLRLWDAVTGKEQKTLNGHTGPISAVAISTSGKKALSASWDRSIRLWDLASGKELQIFRGHTNWVRSAQFSRDGKFMVSTARDGTTRLWNLASGKEIVKIIHFEDGEWIVITPEGYFNASPGGAKHLNVRVGNQVYSIDNFYEKFFNPVYVASVLQGKKVEATADIRKGIQSPPDVRIVSPQPGSQFNTDNITIKVAAKDTGGGIDEIRLYHNGKALGDDQRGVKIVETGAEKTRDFAVTLVDGLNTFRAVGFSSDRTESNPYEIAVQLAAPSKDVSLYVFAVGINKYKNPALNLNYAVPDAKGIAGFFRQKSQLFKKVNIIEIYDEEATKDGILAKLRELEKTHPQDAVLIYLAGHGENVMDVWYFIPHELTYPEREEHVQTKGISSPEFSEAMKKIRAQKILLLVDACKSGAVLVAFRGFEDRKALSQLSRSTGTHVVAASTKDQFAAEVKDLGHGVFTYTLLEGLKGKAAGGSETVTVRKLMGYIEEQLPEVTKRYKQEAQFPVVDSRGMDFPLAIVR